MATAGGAAPTLPKARKIPQFGSEAEERGWWASHDTSELPGQDMRLRLARSRQALSRVVAVTTDAATLNRLKRLAAERGQDYHEMMRVWIQERLLQGAATK
jgi:hypothetical protein